VEETNNLLDVRLENISFSYPTSEDEKLEALTDVSFSVKKGEYVALLGRNGSGKSSVAKLIDVLEFPEAGQAYVLGYLSTEESTFWEIRKNCGMVFQNPDNQIVGTTVEEDVAFGPENLGIPSPEIRKRVDDALSYVGLSDLASRQSAALSGGQKQRLAIAGILAMQPQIMVLDEATSMLDPLGRESFLILVERLIREKGITVIHITHDMNEAARTDRVIILDRGTIAMEGKPSYVFSQVQKLRTLGLDVPVFSDLLFSLGQRLGKSFSEDALSDRKIAVQEILLSLKEKEAVLSCGELAPLAVFSENQKKTLLEVKDLSYSYQADDAPSIQNISFSVKEGECLAVIGHSGSGKTTLITHLNGLLRPQSGEVLFHDKDTVLSAKNKGDVRGIRKRVGLLFQYPEYQLFEETVEKDVAFGPKMMGFSAEEIKVKVVEALELVGMDDSFLERSPFGLSGGQKRRVAFAGILAMNPDVLVLDEPAAGLDPLGRKEIFAYIRELKRKGKTIVLVSHNMDEAVSCCDRILVLHGGKSHGPLYPQALFSDTEKMTKLEIQCPEIISLMQEIKESIPKVQPWQYTIKAAVQELLRAAREDF